MSGPPQTVPADSDIWLAEGGEKRRAVREMFDQIAPSYDLLNSIMSLRLHHRWRAFAVGKAAIRPGDSVLDLCCGTGDFLRPLRRATGSGGHLYGIDFSSNMLALAARKGAGSLAAGDACSLPLRSASVDAVTVGWGIRNVPDVPLALTEIARVLRPGGRFVTLDTAQPTGRMARWIAGWVQNRVLPAIGSLFRKREAYTYLPKSTQRFMSREALKAEMERAGFSEVGYRDLFFGNICVHWGRLP